MTLTTYKTFRQTHNPWQTNNFIGNLNPDNPDEANLIDEIHSYIDEIFSERILGVTNLDRFETLMRFKLAEIEPNFFRSFMLDKHFDDLLDMLKNIDMLSDTNTDTNLSGTNKSSGTSTRTDDLTQTTNTTRTDDLTQTTDTTRTDDLTSTKSKRQDISEDDISSKETRGARKDTEEIENSGKDKKTLNFGIEKIDTVVDYGKVDTTDNKSSNTNNSTILETSRAVNSQYPQSNIGMDKVGIDALVDWNYASAVQDNKNNRTDTGKQDTTNNTTVTQSGSDLTSVTRDKGDDDVTTEYGMKTDKTLNTGEQIINNSGSKSNNFTEGEQSVSNTGTQKNDGTVKNTGTQTNAGTVKNTGNQDVRTKEDREHQQVGKYHKLNDNSGRTDNLAKIRLEWRNLLHNTLSAYQYLFNQLDSLFISIWDIEDDCFFTIV